MRNNSFRKLKLNTITALLLQITTLICGFILPRMILDTYGTEVNGLVNSISQFLGVISLLDLGVGSVVISSLYKPLVENDTDTISKIYVSANKFFKRLAFIFLSYITVLLFIYPLIINKDFDYIYTVTLIGSICISSFAQYYFGIVNSLLVTANQKGYIQYTANIVTLILNTIACTLLIKCGGTIQMVKLTTSLIFMARPLFLYLYVKRNYHINRRITYDQEPIKQKWNGMAQHFAAFILGGTDNIILTIFSTLANVSVYSVYNTIIMGVKNVLLSVTNGFTSLIGEMIAKKEEEKLKFFFGYVEWFLHTGTTLFFGCTAILIVPFVKVYTCGIDDANYVQPLFALIITFASGAYCLRLPYNILILAAGHYKQTQNNYIIAMISNIVISILTVKFYGLIGVAIGTLVAMLYQTIWMAWYNSKNIIKWPFRNFIKHIATDIIIILVSSLATFAIPMKDVTYLSWFILAIKVFLIWFLISFIINAIFYKQNTTRLFNKMCCKIFKRRN